MFAPTPYDDKTLLSQVAQSDQPSFTRLVDQYWNDVYSHALAYTKSSPRAQEITQDVFLRIWRTRERLLEVENFRNYLFILSRNHIVSAMRKKLEETEAIDPLETAESDLNPDEQLQYKEIYAAIHETIEKLPPARRAVFKMSRLEGLTYEEIASRMNISRNTVKDHIVQALIFLRSHLHRILFFLIYFKIF